jgi:Glycosyltransferases involved in cell wall biogenesis
VKVRILLSTYNGEKYLREQIESIISQTYKEWELTVRDDGSSDNTVQILEQYCVKDNRITIIKGKNVGVVQSFYELVKYDSSDYYFFCDQDDVWLPEKLEIILKEAKKHDNSKPILYHNDLKVVNNKLETIREKFARPVNEFSQELVRNFVTGCASAINAPLAELWDTTDNVIMHDYFLAQIASFTGKTVFIDKPLQLYRQHENNVWGLHKPRRIESFFKGERPIKDFWSQLYINQKQAENLLKYKQFCSEEDWTILNDFLSLNEQNIFKRLIFLRKHRLIIDNQVSFWIFNLMLFTHFGYKKLR